jgi:4-amino-4-deoxy-L-arabinose transferase-like glycosyltransferase
LKEKLQALIAHRYFVPACLGAGLVLRLLWILLIHHDQVSDFAWYYQRGMEVAGGQGYSVNGMPTAYWPAGYPLFLGGLFYLFGPIPFVAKLANVIFCGATIWLTYLFAKKVFRSVEAARIAALLLALYPGQIAYSSILTTEMLFQFLLVLGAVLFVYAEDRPVWWALSGVVWGLATLTKTQALFVPVLFLLVFLWRKKGMFKAGIVIYATLLLALSPWLVRNYRMFGQPLLSTNGGIVLMIGNNPYATGNQIWDDNVRSLLGDLSNDYDANHIKGRELQREQRARQVAINFMIGNPAQDLLLWPKKFLATYKSDIDGLYYSMGTVKNPSRPFELAYLALKVFAEIYYLALFALFLIALPTVIHGKIRGARIGLYLALYFTFVYVVYFGNARYHFSIMPFVIMYSAVAITRWLRSPHGAKAESPIPNPQPAY